VTDWERERLKVLLAHFGAAFVNLEVAGSLAPAGAALTDTWSEASDLARAETRIIDYVDGLAR